MKILCAENDLYLAEIGRPAVLRVALGPRVAPDYDRSYWEKGGSGCLDADKRMKAIGMAKLVITASLKVYIFLGSRVLVSFVSLLLVCRFVLCFSVLAHLLNVL